MPPQLGRSPVVPLHADEQDPSFHRKADPVDQAAIATGHLEIGRSPFQTDDLLAGDGRVSSLRQFPRFLHS